MSSRELRFGLRWYDGREPVLGDEGKAVDRAADEAEAVGQQRQGEHTPILDCRVREGAQDGAVVDVEELDGGVGRAGERVLVDGSATRAYTLSVCSFEKVF